MIHNLDNIKYHIEYYSKKPKEESVILFYNNNEIICDIEGNKISFLRYKEIQNCNCDFIYLFSVGEDEYYLAMLKGKLQGFEDKYNNINKLRTATPKHLAFAGFCGYHLYGWYRDNQFCGRCGNTLSHDDKDRVLVCGNCGNMVYPKISPAVIVSVSDGDKLLMTKYNGREYTNYALVAGFVEVGEGAEDTARREVMEEVGLKIKNIRYYKTQPWGITGTFLIGLFAELDGDPAITLDENELSEACWVKREDIDVKYNNMSLTNDMICMFKDNK